MSAVLKKVGLVDDISNVADVILGDDNILTVTKEGTDWLITSPESITGQTSFTINVQISGVTELVPITVICSDPSETKSHIHDGVKFTYWQSMDSLPTYSGSYYLVNDVTISEPYIINNNQEINLCLNGHTITLNNDQTSIKIYTDSTTNTSSIFSLYDCNPLADEGLIEHNGLPGVILGTGGIFNMYGGTISGTTNCSGDTNGGGVCVNDNALFNMYDGLIKNNTVSGSNASGGGVYIKKADDINSGGIFNIEGGRIAENSVSGTNASGNGVYNGGKFIMHDGSINGNRGSAVNGGGVYNDGHFMMSGGSITWNSASSKGGGVYNNSGDFTISGNSIIEGNNCSDIFLIENNVYLPYGKTILVEDLTCDDDSIGITTVTKGIFTGEMADGTDYSKFISDDRGYVVTRANPNRAQLSRIDSEPPQDLNLTYGEGGEISSAVTTDYSAYGYTYEYQWYHNDKKDIYSGTKIPNAIEAKYYIPVTQSVGTHYYYCQITVKHNGQPYVYITSLISTVTIAKREVTLSWSDPKLIYTGNPQAPTATAGNLVQGDTCNVIVSGAETNVGTSYTATATSLDNSNYKLPSATTTPFSISAKSISDAKVELNTTNLDYNGSEQSVSVTKINLPGYTIGTSDYTVTGNKGTNADTYTLTVTGTGNYKDTATASWVINKIKMTVSAPDVNVTYDGKAHGITVSVTAPSSGATVKYGTAEGSYTSTSSPTITDAGEMTVYYQVTASNYIDYTGSAKVTVAKADSAMTTAPKAHELTYTGSAQKLISAGIGTGGEVQYALGSDASTKPDESAYSKDIPTGTNAGTYYVWSRVKGDKNHNNTDPAVVAVTISPKIVYTCSEGTGQSYTQGSDTTLKFVFKRSENDSLTFVKFDGLRYDGKILTKDKHYTAESGSVKIELLSTVLKSASAGEHTITAAFKDGDPVNVTFTVTQGTTHTVTFNANGHGTAPTTQTVLHGQKAKRPTNPTAEGYTFGGWYTEQACTNAFDFNTAITSDIILYAKWTQNGSGSGSGGQGGSGSSGGSGDSTDPRNSPRTGDTNNPGFWVALMALSILAISGALYELKKRRAK